MKKTPDRQKYIDMVKVVRIYNRNPAPRRMRLELQSRFLGLLDPISTEACKTRKWEELQGCELGPPNAVSLARGA
jgi:hypothetical protein